VGLWGAKTEIPGNMLFAESSSRLTLFHRMMRAYSVDTDADDTLNEANDIIVSGVVVGV
jgi:hypothetical protein